MSKRINVNPDHYKAAGRERPGQGGTRSSKRPMTPAERTRVDRWRKRQQDPSKGKR
jgi:hypothetical protein